jgi:hypothetical protein
MYFSEIDNSDKNRNKRAANGRQARPSESSDFSGVAYFEKWNIAFVGRVM